MNSAMGHTTVRDHTKVFSDTRSDGCIKEYYNQQKGLNDLEIGQYTKHPMGQWQMQEDNRWEQCRNKTELTLWYNKRRTCKKFIIDSIKEGDTIDGLDDGFSGYDLMFKRIE